MRVIMIVVRIYFRGRIEMSTKKETKQGIEKAGIRYLIRNLVSLILQGGILFLAAGNLNIPRAWIYFGITFLYFAISTLVLAKSNSELINERAQKRENTKLWDKVVLGSYIIIGMYTTPVIIGLDVGRFQWSNLGIQYTIIGYILYIISSIFVNWAMVVNKHFEATVRIQEDREHNVITTGPYRLVRHPGYIGAILWAIATPLAIGSLYGLIASAIVTFILIFRTALEDKTLQQELKGYSEYTNKVKYRLFPGIW